jgi:quercetin dioxygenase-like cupin family protein
VTVWEGEGLAELNGERVAARPYDTTQIAPGEWHRFINTGDGPMRILWVYGSTEVTRTFADTGETVDQFER